MPKCTACGKELSLSLSGICPECQKREEAAEQGDLLRLLTPQEEAQKDKGANIGEWNLGDAWSAFVGLIEEILKLILKSLRRRL
jgi:hypothetical protein